jgi:hypothetical protein
MTLRPLRLHLAYALLAPSAAACLAADAPAIAVSGFGSAALTAANTDDARFARPDQVAGAGKHWRTGPDSNFGIQASAAFNDSLSATVQGLVSKTIRDDYGAELTWAFLRYRIDDHFSVRAGRIRPPVYMVSDFVNVGYANTMMRPPGETYSQATVKSFDGADVVYQHGFGETTLTVQFGAGTARPRNPGSAKTRLSPFTALNVQLENGPLSVRIGRADTKINRTDDALLDGFLATLRGAGLARVADDFSITDVRASFTSVGATLDYRNFLVQSEYAVRRSQTRVLPDTTSYYAMLGYRYGKLTPYYYYYGNLKQDDQRSYAGLPETGPLAPVTAAVNTLARTGLQSTHAIGLRWDFYRSAALKMQLDHVTPKDGQGLFVNAQPGFKGSVNVYAVGVDFVF